MKKSISVVLALVLLFSGSISALATGDPEAAGSVSGSGLSQSNIVFDDYLDGSSRSTSVPTVFHDLTKKNYNCDNQCVGVSWLYTNYYFNCNSSGIFNVDYVVYSDTGRPTVMKIGLYDMVQKKIVCSWDTAESSLAGISGSMYFYNCVVGRNYAIAFIAVFDGFSHDTVHGTAVVRH